MLCPQCHQQNPAEAKFCMECAAPLATPCRRCGALLSATAKFCSACAAPVTKSAVAAAAGRRLRDERIGPPTVPDGERKQVTVLLADMKSSLELLADRDPEEARQLLDPVLERLIEAVHHYDGTVNQVLGDGIMAIFGAPVAHEDHAVRACYAALRMQATIERYARDLRARQGADVQVRVGLNSGEVIARAIASGTMSVDYSAVGLTTHLAGRMEQLARPGTILMTANTQQLTEGLVRTVPLGLVPIKGLTEPVPVWELVGAEPARSRVALAAARGLSPFVGREREMDELSAAAGRAAAGHGQVVGVVGEPGAGKSRLIWEFRHSARLQGWVVLDAMVLAFGRGRAYQPLVDILRALLGVRAGDTPAEVDDKVTAHLGVEDGHAFRVPLLDMLEVPVDDERWRALETGQRHRRTLEALIHVLVRRSRRQPLCVIIEDLQWVDADTQAVLGALVDRLPGARILLVLSYRPDFEHGWSSRGAYAHVRVDALPAMAVSALLDDLLGNDPSLDPLKAQVIGHTEGNPFFLEESVRHLAGTGALAGTRGAYRLTEAAAAAPVPPTVQAVLAARIDRLADSDKRVLQTAAALGRDVPVPLLEDVADVPLAAVREALGRLQHAEFVFQSQLFPEIQYTFKHALTLDVAYGSLLRERRHVLDTRILAALEGAERRDDADLDRLAHHAYRGGVWDKAVQYCREAGGRALRRAAQRVAVQHFDRALEALGHLDETADVARLGIDIRLELRNALSPLGEYRRMRQALEAAATTAQAIGDQRRLGLVSAFLANFFTLRGEFATALDHGGRALEMAEATGEVPVRVLANGFVSLAHYGMGEYRLAIERAAQNAAALTGDASRERFGMALLPAVYSRSIMAWSLAELGDFPEALAVSEEALHIAEASEHAHSLVFACLGLGTAHLRQRALPAAVAVLERGLAVCRRGDLPAVLLELAPTLASAYAESGRTGEGEALVEEALGIAVRLRHRLGHWLRTGALAEIHLAARRGDQALPLAQLYVQLAQMVSMRGVEGWAQYLLARAVLAQQAPDVAEAERALEAALALAGQLGMRPLEARVRADLAGVLASSGRDAAAEAHAAAARDLEQKLGLGSPA